MDHATLGNVTYAYVDRKYFSDFMIYSGGTAVQVKRNDPRSLPYMYFLPYWGDMKEDHEAIALGLKWYKEEKRCYSITSGGNGMQKTKIMKEIIGTAIEPYGFKYLKTDGPCRIFVKTLEGVQRYFDPEVTTLNQYINIQESNMEKALFVRLSTDAYGSGGLKSLTHLESITTDGNPKRVRYTDEESFRECLVGISELLIKYGLSQLEDMSVEDEIVSTKIMEKRLYDEHTRLEETFLEKYQLKAILKTEQDIDEMYGNIDKIIRDSCDKDYEEVKELLMMIAAYYGQRICDLTGTVWEYREPAGVTKVCTKFAYIPVLPGFVDVWRNKCSEASWKCFDYDRSMLKQALHNYK